MQAFEVQSKDYNQIYVLYSNQQYPIPYSSIYTQSNSQATFADIEIGDQIIYNSSYYQLKLPSLSSIQKTDDLNTNLNFPSYFSKVFKFYRPIVSGVRNKSVAFAVKILEHLCKRKNEFMKDKLREILGGYSSTVLEYVLGGENEEEVKSRMKWLEGNLVILYNLGNDMFMKFNNSDEELARALDMQIKFITIPNMTIEIKNPGGTTKFAFYKSADNIGILYDNIESSYFQENKCESFIESCEKLCVYKKGKASELQINIKEAKQELSLILKILTAIIKSPPNSFPITGDISNSLTYIKNYIPEISAFETLLQNNKCTNCHEVAKVFQVQCKHKYCVKCFTNIISLATQKLFVLNKLEKKKYQKPKCITCNMDFSQNDIENNLPCYQDYKQNSEGRVELKCVCCNAEGKCKDFIVNCFHICNDCLFENLRNGKKRCPECKSSFEKHKSKYYSHRTQCDGCKKELSSIRYYRKKLCEHNLCINCLKDCSSNKCMIDFKIFTSDISSLNLEIFNTKACQQCNNSYSYELSCDSLKPCDCSLCDSCLLEKPQNDPNPNDPFSTICIKCNTKFGKGLSSFANKHYKACCICYKINHEKNVYIIEECQHIFCHKCFDDHIDINIKDGNAENLMKCPNCFVKYSGAQLTKLIKKEVQDKVLYLIMQKDGKFLNCASCKKEFTISSQNRRQQCPSCQAVTCMRCRDFYHELDDEDCIEKFIAERVAEAEATNDPDGISQCPRCRLPYTKDPKCDHVKCIGINCGIEFCFRCACVRSPMLKHGNHYHRPSCSHYAKSNAEDKYEPECTECFRNKELCPRPKNLKVPRRVSANEILQD
ncbi:hypothetical protein SteCoe_29180 [Stentor coeruleus]|uniref:RING-type domain-containing protein n=1 Tax=Stentor coeruleus TaxID=5963 RepID=A0A1R2B6J5_9CILI|nr:hypothetical protein SteCoe_29180 [Stentor coeruleus]